MREILGSRIRLSEDEMLVFLDESLRFDERIRRMKAIARTINEPQSFEQRIISIDAIRARALGVVLD